MHDMSSILPTNTMLHGIVDGVTPDPATARTTLRRVQQLATDRPTVYLPTHDPVAVARLIQRRVVSPSSGRLPA